MFLNCPKKKLSERLGKKIIEIGSKKKDKKSFLQYWMHFQKEKLKITDLIQKKLKEFRVLNKKGIIKKL